MHKCFNITKRHQMIKPLQLIWRDFLFEGAKGILPNLVLAGGTYNMIVNALPSAQQR